MIRAFNASLEPERVADTLLARIADWIPVSGWAVVANDDEAGPRPVLTRSLTPPLEASARSVSGHVLRTGQMLFTADVSTDARLGRRAGSRAAALGFPLACRGRVVGAVVAVDRAPASQEPRLSQAAKGALEAVLEAGAFALDNALRMQRAEALSVTDDLTQLYNSRYLSQVLRRETKRASRSGRPLSLLFIDLDGFKSVNDTHGHLCGSSALVEAARVIRQNARETDVVARFGGDEFALVLPDTGSDGALSVGERIRERIAAHPFLQPQGLAVRLTVSVGVATLPDVASSAEGLIQAADEAMYAVKDRGKNGIIVASEK